MTEKELSKAVGLTISKPLLKRIVAYYERAYGGVHHANYPMDIFAEHRILSMKGHLERLKSLKPDKKGKCLDSGCGLGIFMALALKSGYNFYGYEIDSELVGIAKDLLRLNKLSANRVLTYEEFLKLKPREFDFITSFEVVEHVQDTLTYFKEMASMLSPKGKLFVETPNYVIPYETHFYVFIPPGPRALKWFFIKSAKRTNKAFFDELNFITNRKIERAMKDAGMKYSNLGVTEWMESIKTPDERRSKIFIRIAEMIKRLHLMSASKYFTSYGFYTPLVYTATRK